MIVKSSSFVLLIVPRTKLQWVRSTFRGGGGGSVGLWIINQSFAVYPQLMVNTPPNSERGSGTPNRGFLHSYR